MYGQDRLAISRRLNSSLMFIIHDSLSYISLQSSPCLVTSVVNSGMSSYLAMVSNSTLPILRYTTGAKSSLTAGTTIHSRVAAPTILRATGSEVAALAGQVD